MCNLKRELGARMGRGRPKKSVSPSPETPNQNTTPKKHNHCEEVNHIVGSSNGSSKGLKNLESIEERPQFENLCEKDGEESKPESEEPRRLWVDVLSNNRNPANGMVIEYVAPKIVNGDIEIDIEEEDIASEMKFWETTLIMYVLGGEVSMHMVKQFMMKTWHFVQLPNMYYHDDGYFLLKFQSNQDMELVLMRGPYTIRNMPMLIREWKPDFNLKQDMLRTLPIWVQLPQLPLHLWGGKSLGKIGSALGTQLVIDECTANKLRVSYARILVEADVTPELRNEITIKDNEGRRITQKVEYEWKPMFCDKCQKFGHKCGEVKPRKQWIPKQKPPEQRIPVVTIVPDKVTPTEPKEKHPDDTLEDWSVVPSTRKDRGKTKQNEGIPPPINCKNGFETLRGSNGPLVIRDCGT